MTVLIITLTYQFKVAKGILHRLSDPILSPNQVAEMHSTYIQQLEQIESLCNDGITKYDGQKDIILPSLRNCGQCIEYAKHLDRN